MSWLDKRPPLWAVFTALTVSAMLGDTLAWLLAWLLRQVAGQ